MQALQISPEPRLLAVSKTKPVNMIEELADAGQQWFGENYCDEMVEKAKYFSDYAQPIYFSYIGALQSNKISSLVQYGDEIQTVMSEKHLRYVAKAVSENHKKGFKVYLQCNYWNEPQKAGVSIEEAMKLAEIVEAKYSELIDLQGLMAIPPKKISDESETNDEPFLKFVSSARLIGKGGASIGMSADWKAASKAGSSCIRVGSLLFGSRS